MITLTATPDRPLVRASGKSVRYLHVRLVAPPTPSGRERAPVHVAFVLDRSGSMAGQRIELAKQATVEALGFLKSRDRFGIVVFDERVETLVAPTAATYAAIEAARERVRVIGPGGSTALCEGWLTGCAQIDAGGDTVARCLLLTDGHANVGEQSPAALALHASELRKRGVATTTFGLGDGFSEELLNAMASAGGGNFWFIEHPAQIRDFFTTELGEVLEVVARDVRLTVSHPAVKVEPMVGYAVAPAPGGATVRLGDLTSDQDVELVVRLTFPDGTVGSALDVEVVVEATGQAPVRTTVPFTYAGHTANDAQPRAVPVDRAVARVYAAEARKVAIVANRAGDFEGAARVLRGTAKRIKSYAGDDVAMLALVEELEGDVVRYDHSMTESSRKREYLSSTSSLRGRESTGKARKYE